MNFNSISNMFKLRRVYLRLKKINRILNMKPIKKILIMVIFFFISFVLIIYHLYHFSFAKNNHKSDEKFQLSSTEQYHGTPMRHIPYNEIHKEIYKHDEDFSIEIEESRQANIINTPGCSIPLTMVDYRKNINKGKKLGCGVRMVFIKKYKDHYVQATINELKMRKQLEIGTRYECCYRFFQRSKLRGHEHLKVQYTPCKILRNGEKIRLESDFLNVQCSEYRNSYKHLIYEDNYAFCRKINKTNMNTSIDRYNVLIIGIDSMSLSRFAQTMKRTILFFKNNNWLGFRGYHKVGDNTLPNLLPALTGKLSSEIIKKCYKRMDQCNDYLLWNIFKKSGYITAYGEDYLHLPDTFSKDTMFHEAPTDHYMRPFFMNREREVRSTFDNHSVLCSGKLTTGEQMLNYAQDFALTYRNDSFFGFFWINSFSHNVNNRPEDADLLFENFFNRIIYTGVLDNTFIVFMSDHGIRFGKHRLQIESYYDNRMPLLFMWVPNTFKNNYPHKLKAVAINQFRLITPYDLFDTLNEINELAVNSYNKTRKYKTLFERQSLFKIVSPNRTCYDVGIHEKWCSCHKLYSLDIEDPEVVRSVQFVASHIKKTLKNIETKRCWNCLNLSLQNITRIHFYYNREKTNLYYVIAFSMSPRNIVYEAVVLRNDTKNRLIGKIDIISHYQGFGDCTIKRSDKIFCICQKINNCQINVKL